MQRQVRLIPYVPLPLHQRYLLVASDLSAYHSCNCIAPPGKPRLKIYDELNVKCRHLCCAMISSGCAEMEAESEEGRKKGKTKLQGPIQQ